MLNFPKYWRIYGGVFGNWSATVGYGEATIRQPIHITEARIFCLPKRLMEDAGAGGDI